MRRPLSLLRILLLCAYACSAQQPGSIDLSVIADRAGIIFRGTVVSVTAEAPRAPGEVASTRILFHVEDAIRGARDGEMLTIRQWNVAPDEYRPGEALVLFLYPPSELGLTSPVAGKDGHRRPAEISNATLDLLRSSTVATENTPSSGDVEPVPVKPPRKIPRNPKKLPREVPQ